MSSYLLSYKIGTKKLACIVFGKDSQTLEAKVKRYIHHLNIAGFRTRDVKLTLLTPVIINKVFENAN